MLIQKPTAKKRRQATCGQWLETLTGDELRKRWPTSGAQGFYEHERLWIARFCAYEEFRLLAQDLLREKEAKRQESRARQEAVKAAAEEERQRNLTLIRERLEGLRTETHGTVREAAMRASQLYLDGSVPRDLKQCIAIAAREHIVSWQSIQAYLAGVGVRVLWANVEASEIWEDD